MSENSGNYRVLTQVHRSWYETDTGQSQVGMELRVRDGETGTVFTVRVPDQYYSADNVEKYITPRLDAIREVHKLGQ